ncbi:MAG: hypothetical protein ACREQQ_05755 [Candidatus Binatia bacterium]
MRAAPLASLALGLVASCASQSAEEIRARRWIRAEPSAARTALALPYQAVADTGWPVEIALDWMEEVNLPARVGDAVRSPLRRSDPPPTSEP